MPAVAPGTSQITYSKAISSTAIGIEWDSVQTAQQYFLLINSSLTGEQYNFSFTNNSAVVRNLQPATTYDCFVVTTNAGGLGARSNVRTVTTCKWTLWQNQIKQYHYLTTQINVNPTDRCLDSQWYSLQQWSQSNRRGPSLPASVGNQSTRFWSTKLRSKIGIHKTLQYTQTCSASHWMCRIFYPVLHTKSQCLHLMLSWKLENPSRSTTQQTVSKAFFVFIIIIYNRHLYLSHFQTWWHLIMEMV